MSHQPLILAVWTCSDIAGRSMDWDSWFGPASVNTVAFPLVFPVKVAAISLVLHAVFGLLLWYYLGKKTSPVRSLVDTLVTLPLVFPPIALGFVLLLVLGKAGLIGRFIASLVGNNYDPPLQRHPPRVRPPAKIHLAPRKNEEMVSGHAHA